MGEQEAPQSSWGDMRQIAKHHIDAAGNQGAQKIHVASEPGEFGEDDGGTYGLRVLESSGELWTVVTLAAFGFDVLGRQRAVVAVEMAGDCLPLSFQTETAAALLVGAYPQVRDELTFAIHSHPLVHKCEYKGP